jgi:hypothetical protein
MKMKAVINAVNVGELKAAARHIIAPFFAVSRGGFLDFDLSEMMRFHLLRNADVTVVCLNSGSPQSRGIIEFDEFDKAKAFTEEMPFFSSDLYGFDGRVYIINPELLDSFPENGKTGFPDEFLKLCIERGKAVFGYRVNVKEEAENTVTRKNKLMLSDSDSFGGIFGDGFDSRDAALIGQALASMTVGRKTGVLTDSDVLSKAVAACISGAMVSQGSRVWSFGEGFYSQLEFYMRFCSLESGLFVHSRDGRVSIVLRGENGLPPSASFINELEKRIEKRDFVFAADGDLRDVSDMSGVAAMYRREILRQTENELSELSCIVKCPNPKITSVLEDCLYQLGCRTGSEITLKINAYGTLLSAFSRECGWVSHDRIAAIIIHWETACGRDVSVSFDSPKIYDDISDANGRRLYRYYHTPFDGTDGVSREKSRANPFMRDALLMAVRLLGIMCATGKSLKSLSDALPDFYVSRRKIPINISASDLRQKLSKQICGDTREGIAVTFDKGRVLLTPSRSGRNLKILSEAADYETSKELCSEIEKLIEL